MKKNSYGFTIVELLIVIVIIGILAATTTVAYNGIQNRALNAARHQEVKAWHSILQAYVTQEGKLPAVPGDYCLGLGFPDGDGVTGGECRDYNINWDTTYHETSSVSLMNELKKVSSLPGGPRKPVNGTVGPYIKIYSNASSYTITTVFNGNLASECPTGMIFSWSDGNGRLLCQIDFTLP